MFSIFILLFLSCADNHDVGIVIDQKPDKEEMNENYSYFASIRKYEVVNKRIVMCGHLGTYMSGARTNKEMCCNNSMKSYFFNGAPDKKFNINWLDTSCLIVSFTQSLNERLIIAYTNKEGNMTISRLFMDGSYDSSFKDLHLNIIKDSAIWKNGYFNLCSHGEYYYIGGKFNINGKKTNIVKFDEQGNICDNFSIKDNDDDYYYSGFSYFDILNNKIIICSSTAKGRYKLPQQRIYQLSIKKKLYDTTEIYRPIVQVELFTAFLSGKIDHSFRRLTFQIDKNRHDITRITKVLSYHDELFVAGYFNVVNKTKQVSGIAKCSVNGMFTPMNNKKSGFWA